MSLENPAARLVALGLAGSLAALSCSPQSPSDPEQTVGGIRVEVTTSGTGVPASFSVTLDGGSPRSIAPNGTTTFSSLVPGSYAVGLSVPSNCAISGASSRSVTVREGITSDVAFSVDCTAIPTGAIGVTTITTGDPPDPDGYSLTVDGSPGPSIGTNATALIPDLGLGDHEVGLTGVAENCAVQDANPRTVAVSQNQTTQTEFEIVCSATTGLIDVSVTTTGPEPDADGYTVNLDGSSSQSVGSNGSVTFTGVEEGGHTLTLEDLAPNCTVDGENPASADVVAGQTTDVSFSVVCEATVGSLEVTASTTGSEQDPNGYAVSVDGGPEQPLGVNGSTTFADLPAGPHDVELTGVAANCAVAGDNPRSVDVTAGQTASTTFDVTCASTVGSIEVTVTTTGDAIDADGYTVVLDGGADTQLVDPDDVITFGGLAPGEHTLALQNVADNCTVTSDNPTTADVTAGQTTPASFAVVCEQLTGDIQVNTTTTGSDPDPDGYQVAVDGGTPLSIGINGSRTFQDEVIGEHEVELTGVAANCAVQGDNPRTITVNQDQITQVNFSVDCSSTTGQIEVTVTTTGDDPDPDGYTIDLDGTSSRSVATNGSTTFTGVTPGSHTLTLQNAASNCTVTSSNPVNTNVTAGSTSNVSFDVECTRLTGDIRVFTSSSGSPVDANGYQVSVDGGAARAIGINDQELYADLQPGNHTVTLSDVAPQCTVSGSTTRNVSVSADQETQVTFTVTCDPLEGDIQVNVSTSGEDLDSGYTIRLDGGTPRSVGTNGSTTYTSVPTGDHQVSLNGIATNCSVSGSNQRSVTVVDEQTAVVNFSVTCVERTGSVQVNASTSGPDQDTQYSVTLSGGQGTMTLPADGSTTFTDVPEGNYTVTLSDVAANCTDDDGDNQEPVTVTFNNTSQVSFSVSCSQATGSVQVNATTTGDDQDTEYSVSLSNGQGSMTLPANGSTTFTDVPEGNYTATLSGIAANCTDDDGDNQESVSVTLGNTSQVNFTVSCVERTGSVQVNATTTGDDLDTEYSVTLSGGQGTMTLPADGSTTFTNVPEGNYTVTLSDVAANCTDDDGDNQEPVTVTFNTTAQVNFTVSCVERTGSVQVNATTTGDDLDTEYSVTLSGGQATQALPANGSTTFTDVPEGGYTVTLSDLAANCTDDDGDNQEPVTVTFNATAQVNFSVTCDPTTGSLNVTVTDGAGTPDADGYLVSVDGGADEFIDAATPVLFEDLSATSHTVLLSGLGACTVSSPSNPATPTVIAGDTVDVDFTVGCP